MKYGGGMMSFEIVWQLYKQSENGKATLATLSHLNIPEDLYKSIAQKWFVEGSNGTLEQIRRYGL